MPSYTIPGFRRNAIAIAAGGTYDPQQHLDNVLMPVLREWRIFERNNLNGEGERNREAIHDFLINLKSSAYKFGETKAKYLEAQKKKAKRQTRDGMIQSSQPG